MTAPDRRDLLLAQAPPLVTGIDFVTVHPDHRTLDVFFIVPPLAVVPSLASLSLGQARIHAGAAPTVELASAAWAVVDGRDVWRLTATAPGGFERAVLSIDDPRVDRFFNHVGFSWKAACPSPFDCAPEVPACPDEPAVDVAIDTTARDFGSLRRALLDFAAARYPHWQDRLEADVGVMLTEVLAAVGDELAYYQDRVARETALATASQRRSVRRHARLVDHHVHDGLGATTWLEVQVREEVPALPPQQLVAGTPAWAAADGGQRVWFEIGRGLAEALATPPVGYDVRSSVNRLWPHLWDESATCLPVGATELYLEGHHAAELVFELPVDAAPGRWVLLATTPTDPARPERRWLVRVIEVTDTVDPLVSHPVFGHAITRIRWDAAQATPFPMDLDTLVVSGNLVPATAGRTVVDRGFRVGDSPLALVPSAVERSGPDGTTAYLFTLPDGEGEGLVWLGATPRTARPELVVREATPALVGPDLAWTDHADGDWRWRRALLGPVSSRPGDRHFTLDDGTWDRAVAYQRLGGEFVHRDYLAGVGVTVRFGDGEFGAIPPVDTWFHVIYRLGNGARGNLPPDVITHLDPTVGFVAAIRNPLPSSGGVEPESVDEARRLAPDEFRAITYRAVRPEDYAEAAERLPWVQRAGARLRWTGSWLAAFVTADPHDASSLSPAQAAQLHDHLDRFRQAGREVRIRPPRYADLDLSIHVCVEPDAYAGQVHAAIRAALFQGPRAFFHPDRFTFGTPLDRSELEAAIQAVPGVRAIDKAWLRRRRRTAWKLFVDLQWRPAAEEVVRVTDDPRFPERGTLQLHLHGGS